LESISETFISVERWQTKCWKCILFECIRTWLSGCLTAVIGDHLTTKSGEQQPKVQTEQLIRSISGRGPVMHYWCASLHGCAATAAALVIMKVSRPASCLPAIQMFAIAFLGILPGATFRESRPVNEQKQTTYYQSTDERKSFHDHFTFANGPFSESPISPTDSVPLRWDLDSPKVETKDHSMREKC